MKYDYLIIGAGITGASVARIKKDQGFTVKVIEKTDFIGGNCRDELRDGIMIHLFGSHIFHTTEKWLWDWVNQFEQFNQFTTYAKSMYKGKLYSLPVNLQTIYDIYGENTPQRAFEIIQEKRINIPNPKNAMEYLISYFTPEIYEILFEQYFIKQWGRDAEFLSPDIAKRQIMRTSFNTNYYDCPFVGIPKGGYTQFISSLLKDIDIETHCNFLKDADHYRKQAKKIIYTGSIDEYFEFEYGMLDYRTLRFEFEKIDMVDYQGTFMVAYPELKPNYEFTRIIEHKHFYPDRLNETDYTWIHREYPEKWTKKKPRLYPQSNPIDKANYKKYLNLANKEKNVKFAGRLGTYQYLNMDKCILQAFDICENF